MIWRIMYTDLRQGVSYHSLCNLYVPLLRETVCEYFLHCCRIPLSISSASLSSQF